MSNDTFEKLYKQFSLMIKSFTKKYKEWYQFNYKKGGKLDYIKLYNNK